MHDTNLFRGIFLFMEFIFFFLSLKFNDMITGTNKIFNKKFMVNYSTTMSYAIPFILTFFIWASQVINQSSDLRNKTYEDIYPDKKENNNMIPFRYMYCWVNRWNSFILYAICFILIVAILYFSYKSLKFIKNTKKLL